MRNNENNIDQVFRDGLEDFEVPFNESHWKEMESQIDQQFPAPSNGFWTGSKVAMIAGTIALVATAIYFTTDPESKQKESVTSEQTEMKSENEDASAQISTEENSEMESNETIYQNESTGEEEVTENISTDPEKPLTTKTDDGIEDEIMHKSSMSEHAINTEAQKFVDKDIPRPIADKSTENYNNRQLKTSFSADKTILCAGESAKFTVEKNFDNVSYFWNFGDGNTSTQKNPTVTFNKSGNYTVTLIVSKGEKNDYENVIENYITVNKAPKVEITWDDSELSLEDPYIEFKAKSTLEITNYTWKIDGKSYDSEIAAHRFTKQGMYSVELVSKQGSCSSTIRTEFNLSNDPPPFIESGYFLDYDGVNDEFPSILSSINVVFELAIYDLNNRLVYKTTDSNRPWNGRINNSGEMVSVGKYRVQFLWKDKNGNSA